MYVYLYLLYTIIIILLLLIFAVVHEHTHTSCVSIHFFIYATKDMHRRWVSRRRYIYTAFRSQTCQ